MPMALWKCPLCKAVSVVGAKKCTVCKKPYTGTEERVRDPQVTEVPPADEQTEKDQQLFRDFDARLERASQEIGKVSIPPRGAVRLEVPVGPLGWLTTGIVVLALAITMAILKSLF